MILMFIKTWLVIILMWDLSYAAEVFCWCSKIQNRTSRTLRVWSWHVSAFFTVLLVIRQYVLFITPSDNAYEVMLEPVHNVTKHSHSKTHRIFWVGLFKPLRPRHYAFIQQANKQFGVESIIPALSMRTVLILYKHVLAILILFMLFWFL
jgi:hypothetical protein